MAKPEPTVLAYGMREVSHGKWEAFRVRVPVGMTEALTPVHRVGLNKLEWAMGKVPDHREPDNPRALLDKKILVDVPDIDPKTKEQRSREVRGERQELAEHRMREAQRLEQQLSIRKPAEPKRKSA